jgi:hypothetical protein
MAGYQGPGALLKQILHFLPELLFPLSSVLVTEYLFPFPSGEVRRTRAYECIQIKVSGLPTNFSNMPGPELQQKNRTRFRLKSLLQEETCYWKTISQ